MWPARAGGPPGRAWPVGPGDRRRGPRRLQRPAPSWQRHQAGQWAAILRLTHRDDGPARAGTVTRAGPGPELNPGRADDHPGTANQDNQESGRAAPDPAEPTQPPGNRRI